MVEVAFGRNLALDAEVIALGGTKAAYASDAEPEPRLPFWPLLFKNVTIRLVGSDDLPEGCLAGRSGREAPPASECPNAPCREPSQALST